MDASLRAGALPGADLIERGIRDLEIGLESVESLLVSIGAPRLGRVGLTVPTPHSEPEHRLYRTCATDTVMPPIRATTRSSGDSSVSSRATGSLGMRELADEDAHPALHEGARRRGCAGRHVLLHRWGDRGLHGGAPQPSTRYRLEPAGRVAPSATGNQGRALDQCRACFAGSFHSAPGRLGGKVPVRPAPKGLSFSTSILLQGARQLERGHAQDVETFRRCWYRALIDPKRLRSAFGEDHEPECHVSQLSTHPTSGERRERSCLGAAADPFLAAS